MSFKVLSCSVSSVVILLIGITAAHIIEPLLGAWVLNKRQKFFLQNHNDYLRLVIFSGVIVCFIGANISVSSLLLVGFLQKDQYLENALLWWMGDTLGVILVAPLILAWSQSIKYCSQKNQITHFRLRNLC